MSFRLIRNLLLISITSGFYFLSYGVTAAELDKPIKLELVDSVIVTGKQYTLADLVADGGTGSECIIPLCSEVLGLSPRPGLVARITRSQMAARLEAMSAGSYQSIQFKGASIVKVRSVGVTLDSLQVQRFASSYLNKVLAQRFTNYSFRPVDSLRELIVPKGKLTFEASINKNQRTGKRTCVWVDIIYEGIRYQRLPVWFEVESIQTVWIIKEDRSKHDYIDESVLKQVEYDVALLADDPLTVEEAVDRMRLTKAVTAGQVLTQSIVEPIPPVEKGDIVTVHVQSGRIYLRAQAIALSDGDLTKRIHVKNRSHGGIYDAVVVGKGEVAANDF
jgi:flagella basal body P-ring formation protein FlgA